VGPGPGPSAPVRVAPPPAAPPVSTQSVRPAAPPTAPVDSQRFNPGGGGYSGGLLGWAAGGSVSGAPPIPHAVTLPLELVGGEVASHVVDRVGQNIQDSGRKMRENGATPEERDRGVTVEAAGSAVRGVAATIPGAIGLATGGPGGALLAVGVQLVVHQFVDAADKECSCAGDNSRPRGVTALQDVPVSITSDNVEPRPRRIHPVPLHQSYTGWADEEGDPVQGPAYGP